MFKRLAVIGTFTLILAAMAVPAHAQVRVGIAIGAPVARPVVVAPPPAPYPGYVWQPAHYVRTAYGYQMVPGAWVPAPYPVAAPYPYGYPYRYPAVVAPRASIGFGIRIGGHRHW